MLHGAGDEHQHAGARRGPREPRDAGGARRALRRSRRRLSRLRLDRQGPARRAGRDRRSRRSASCSRAARCSDGSSSSPPDRPTRTSTTCGIIGNRSSGKMGYAVAAEAARRGARVILVSGPVVADAAGGRRAGARAQRRADARRRAATRAPTPTSSSWPPPSPTTRRSGARPARSRRATRRWSCRWCARRTSSPTLGTCARRRARPVLVGFAAESGDPVERGRQKLLAQGRRSSSSPTTSRPTGRASTRTLNAATIISRDGVEALPLGPKTDLAAIILDRAEATARAAQPTLAPSPWTRDALAEHLRFFQELGVTGISRRSRVARA